MNDLKRVRICKELSQIELSRISKIHPSRISLVESGKATPSLSEMRRISEALGILPEEVFGLGEVMKRLTASRKKEAEGR